MEGTGKYDDATMLRPPTVLDIPVHGFKEAPDQPVAPRRKYWRDPNDPAPAEPVRWVRRRVPHRRPGARPGRVHKPDGRRHHNGDDGAGSLAAPTAE